MGVTPSCFAMLKTAIALGGCRRMIELGDQAFHLAGGGLEMTHGKPIVKRWAEAEGIEHVSIDLNANNGALPLDLSQPIEGIEPGDIVTNFGTSEHVGPKGQDACFANIIRLCRSGGLMLHAIPLEGHWPGHSSVTYPKTFFDADMPGTKTLTTWLDSACGSNQWMLMAIVRRLE